MPIDFRLYADWNQDGDWDDVGEDITDDVISLTWSLGMRRLWQSSADEATLQAQLRNDAGRYNPENSSSALYGQIKPQVPIVLKADGATLWRGWLDFIDVNWTPGGVAHGAAPVMLYALGVKQRLDRADLSIPLQLNKRGDQLIEIILGRVVLPPSAGSEQAWLLGMPGYSELGLTTSLGDISQYSDLETGTYTFAVYGSDKTRSAGQMITEITEAERGKFFIGRDGRAYWWNQNHILDYAPPDATVDDDGVLGPKANEIRYSYGKHISNSIGVTFTPRKIDTSTLTLWTLDTAIYLQAGERRQIECLFVDADGQQVGADESSLALTGITWQSNPGILEDGAVSIDVRLGDRAYLMLDNTSPGTLPANLTAVQITGKKVSARNSMTVREEDALSLGNYQKRALDMTLALDNPGDATNVAQLELARRKDAQGIVESVKFLNPNDGVGNAHHLTWGIDTRLRVKLGARFGHDQDYMVVGETHTIDEGMKKHQTIFYLERLILKRLAYYAKSNADTEVVLRRASDAEPKTRLCQNFQTPYAKACGKVRLWLRKVGNPTATLTVKLYSASQLTGWVLGVATLGVNTVLGQATPEPTTLLATSETKAATSVDTGFRWIEFNFSTPTTLAANTDYSLVLEASASGDATNYFIWGADSSSHSYAEGEMIWDDGGIYWREVLADASFEVYAA